MTNTVEYDFSDLEFQPEKNELSQNAKGGTELMLNRLYSSLDKNLLSQFQIIPTRVRDLSSDKKKIWWIHDLPADPEVRKLEDVEYRKQFDGIVFVSNWQQQMFNIEFDMEYSESVVIKNAIEPIEIDTQTTQKPNPQEEIRLIYHTTPHRGLEILAPVFAKLCEVHENLRLDVYSSFEIYGWKQRDEQYQELFEYCRQHPNIHYHGVVSNEEIREALKKSHIFAYPSIWAETSCLAAIEAMSAKNIVVCPNLAGLFETCHDWAVMYNFEEDRNQHANVFASVLHSVISTLRNSNESGYLENRLRNQKSYYDSFYNWSLRKLFWQNYLEKLSSENN